MPSSRSSKLVRLALAAAIAASGAIATTAVTVATATTAQAASSVGGQITRSEVLARAKVWVDDAVPYSQSSYHTDGSGTLYRQDCSGFVSMAWHINNSGTNNGFTTNTAVNYSTQLAGLDSLKPGDTLNNISTHMVLFVGWTDSNHTAATIYEEPNSSSTARSRVMTRSEMTSGGFLPYRYNKIVDGSTTPSRAGVFRPSNATFYVSDASGGVGGYASFGAGGDTPLVGDWNGDGKATFGVYRASDQTFYLSNDNSSVAVARKFGNPGDIPVVGDWDGNGTTTIGIYRPSDQTFYLSNDNSSVSVGLKMGDPGDIPVVGDWDGNGTTTVGIYRPSTGAFAMTDSTTSTPVQHTVSFGNTGDVPIVGDWDGTGTDKVGVYRPQYSDFYGAAKDSGTVIYSARFGVNGDVPVVGKW
ncbi:hypothetical protein [Kitasatospora sp. CB02891]|uniref:hypothetical protein n=1 Tax=Kitasatospora sp. CB02891 TaxID=2020329 RepID=UPI000C27D1CA|nr:hypothetical protein [Kitasatospora sp. CB02891]PJN23804.1 hypothetical protein CG736_21335 [Kitasatospora sp. CB02891]